VELADTSGAIRKNELISFPIEARAPLQAHSTLSSQRSLRKAPTQRESQNRQAAMTRFVRSDRNGKRTILVHAGPKKNGPWSIQYQGLAAYRGL